MGGNEWGHLPPSPNMLFVLLLLVKYWIVIGDCSRLTLDWPHVGSSRIFPSAKCISDPSPLYPSALNRIIQLGSHECLLSSYKYLTWGALTGLFMQIFGLHCWKFLTSATRLGKHSMGCWGLVLSAVYQKGLANKRWELVSQKIYSQQFSIDQR